jgi:glycosyltransferase involved in cell wall biosynthesis
MLAARLSGLPFSFTAHAKDIYRIDMNPGDLLNRKLRAASFTVTCTQANVDYLARLSDAPQKIHRIYHGSDLQLFSQNRRPEPASPPLILAIGRFVEKKGFPILVAACRILREAGIDFQARIVGGFTPLTAEIERMVEEYGLDQQVHLHPAMTQEELTRFYATATLFALPCLITDDGDRDGIPNVLVEAMASGLPVVSTRVSGIPELVRDGETGLLVEPRDPVALAAAIRRLLEDIELRTELGRRGRELVQLEFDARRNIAALKKLFESAVANGRDGAA